MWVCAKQRHSYGKFWRQSTTCQYPTHPGSDSKGVKSQYSVYKGLDNTAAEGADGFKDFLQIIDKLERVGAEKDLCKEVRKRLQESKLYLKTTYRNHREEDDSKCADHRKALNWAMLVTLTFWKCTVTCSHNVKCEDCEKSFLEEIKGAISEYTVKLEISYEQKTRISTSGKLSILWREMKHL